MLPIAGVPSRYSKMNVVVLIHSGRVANLSNARHVGCAFTPPPKRRAQNCLFLVVFDDIKARIFSERNSL